MRLAGAAKTEFQQIDTTRIGAFLMRTTVPPVSGAVFREIMVVEVVQIMLVDTNLCH